MNEGHESYLIQVNFSTWKKSLKINTLQKLLQS